MKEKNILQDKLNQATVKPSDKLWHKVETGLQKEDKILAFQRRSVMGWAAAVIILILAFFAGRYELATPAYTPETLEINDQASEIQLQKDFFPMHTSKYYRKDGRLIPNFQTIWEHPLVPAGKSL